MVKENEIRIGNWFRHLPVWSNRQPDEMPMKDFNFQWDDNDWYQMAEGCMGLDRIKSIPLTPQILEKCGFVNDLSIDRPDYRQTAKWVYNKFVIWADWVGGQCMYDGVSIKTVHQLQNLFFALTGEELIINL